MADIKDFLNAEPVTVKEFFMSEKVFQIPPYQREYSWERKEVEQFFDDVIWRDSEETYFIGSTILLQLDGSSTLEIIDGQQRSTTISLIYASILYISTYMQLTIEDENLKSQIDILVNNILELLKKESTDKLVLSEQKNNKQDFHNIVNHAISSNNELSTLVSQQLTSVDRRRRLYKNFDFIFTKILDLIFDDFRKSITQHHNSTFLEEVDRKWIKELIQVLFNFTNKKIDYIKVEKHFQKLVKKGVDVQSPIFSEYIGKLNEQESILYLIKSFSFEDTNTLYNIIKNFDTESNKELAENCSGVVGKNPEELFEELESSDFVKDGIKAHIEKIIKEKEDANTKNLEEHIIPRINTFFGQLFQILQKIKQTMDQTALVKMIVKNPSSANNLFETINYRGLPLSAMDLIKNDILRSISIEDSQSEEENKNLNKAIKQWTDLVDSMDTPDSQIRYLRHFYIAKYITEDNFKSPTKSNIVDLYKEKFSIAPKKYEFYKNLIDISKLYLFMTNFDIENNVYKFKCPKEQYDSIKELFLDISHFNAIPSLSMFLWLIKNETDIEVVKSIYSVVKRFFIKRHISGIPEVKYLDGYFEKILKEFTKGEESYIDIVKGVLEKNEPSAEMIRERLYGGIYESNKEITRYLLIELNNKIAKATPKESVDLWGKNNKNKYIFSIEHIIPQNDDIDDNWNNQRNSVVYWQNVLANKCFWYDRSFSENIKKRIKNTHIEILHKLGNLTLTAYNSSLSDDIFINKRDAIDTSGKPIGFKNGLPLNCDLKFEVSGTEKALCTLDRFNHFYVEKRGQKMIQLIEEMLEIKTPA